MSDVERHRILIGWRQGAGNDDDVRVAEATKECSRAEALETAIECSRLAPHAWITLEDSAQSLVLCIAPEGWTPADEEETDG